MKKKEMTIHELAKLAGVSVATVSRSLNNSPLVKEKTKEKILRIADEVGFECNASARGLVTSRAEHATRYIGTQKMYDDLTLVIMKQRE